MTTRLELTFWALVFLLTLLLLEVFAHAVFCLVEPTCRGRFMAGLVAAGGIALMSLVLLFVVSPIGCPRFDQRQRCHWTGSKPLIFSIRAIMLLQPFLLAAAALCAYFCFTEPVYRAGRTAKLVVVSSFAVTSLAVLFIVTLRYSVFGLRKNG
jgi:hypothetical protein